MEDEDPSHAFERAQVLLDHLLLEGQIAGTAVHHGRHIRLQQDIERIVLAQDGRLDFLLCHRGDSLRLDGAHPHAQ